MTQQQSRRCSSGTAVGAERAPAGCHGMVEALAAVGLDPDLVVGTSVGSLNGAVVAEHKDLAVA